MTLRIGLIDYLNPAPFAWDLEQRLAGVARFDRDVPAKQNERLLSGEIDAALVSSHFAAEHADELLVLPGFSVTAHRDVRSVLLFSWHEDLEDLAGRRVSLSASSASSVALLRWLLGEVCAQSPAYHTAPQDLKSMLSASDAALVIGDEALREGHLRRALRDPAGEAHTPYVFDIAEQWRARTGLPFVFAVWAVRPAALERLRAAGFTEVLAASLEGGLEHLPEIAAAAAPRLGLPAEACLAYLRNLSYRLGAEELAGLEAFLERAFPVEGRPGLRYG